MLVNTFSFRKGTNEMLFEVLGGFQPSRDLALEVTCFH